MSDEKENDEACTDNDGQKISCMDCLKIYDCKHVVDQDAIWWLKFRIGKGVSTMRKEIVTCDACNKETNCTRLVITNCRYL